MPNETRPSLIKGCPDTELHPFYRISKMPGCKIIPPNLQKTATRLSSHLYRFSCLTVRLRRHPVYSAPELQSITLPISRQLPRQKFRYPKFRYRPAGSNGSQPPEEFLIRQTDKHRSLFSYATGHPVLCRYPTRPGITTRPGRWRSAFPHSGK